MASFYRGQKVKKISGFNTGVVGVVHDYSPTQWSRDEGCDMRVVLDAGTICLDGLGRQVPVTEGRPVSTTSSQWAPLTPPHEACDPEFAESLNELVNRQGVGA